MTFKFLLQNITNSNAPLEIFDIATRFGFKLFMISLLLTKFRVKCA